MHECLKKTPTQACDHDVTQSMCEVGNLMFNNSSTTKFYCFLGNMLLTLKVQTLMCVLILKSNFD